MNTGMVRSRATKAQLLERLDALEKAFDRLMASHLDCTSGYPFDMEWAKRIERETDAVRWRHK